MNVVDTGKELVDKAAHTTSAANLDITLPRVGLSSVLPSLLGTYRLPLCEAIARADD